MAYSRLEKELVRTAFNGLRKLWDRERSGFWDALVEKGGKLAVRDSKKLNYNSVCLIALLDYLDDAEYDDWASERAEAQVRYLVKRFNESGCPAPSFEGAETKTFTWGEQGLLLWALSKAFARGTGDKNAVRKACEGLRQKICGATTRNGIPEIPGTNYFVPMDNAFCLDALVESEGAGFGEARAKETLAAALEKNFVPPVFLIKKNARVLGRVSFNNIAYPLHAISRYYLKNLKTRSARSAEARKTVGDCAIALLASQGPLGQWWWTWDARGRVVQKYPVYSVHQDGMAVMALRKASEALGKNIAVDKAIDKAIGKSVAWVFGENELGARLVDEEKGVVWRSIRCPWLIQKARRFAPFVPEVFLRIKKECRSYHLAWILYAAKC